MSDTNAPVKLPLGAEDIAAMLPHRYPFLLLDRVVAFERAKRVTALKNVTINEPFFQGHFPGHPVMPGVLITEIEYSGGDTRRDSGADESYEQRFAVRFQISEQAALRILCIHDCSVPFRFRCPSILPLFRTLSGTKHGQRF